MTSIEQVTSEAEWYALSVDDVVVRVGADAERGLDAEEVQRRLAQFGRNEVASEPPPTLWEVAKGQLLNPMNIMLLIVSIASLAIGQVPTGVIVAALVSFNVIMGTSQERKAMASVEALTQLRVPLARVRRSGSVEQVDSSGLVPQGAGSDLGGAVALSFDRGKGLVDRVVEVIAVERFVQAIPVDQVA